MIFEVTPEQIELLGDTDLRTLIGYLCEEEVRVQGHSTAAVTWGGHQNAADGGIDVRVALADDAVISGYVPRAATGFQVKAEDLPRRQILEEMAPGGIVRKSIADLIAKCGAYIVVSSRGSVADDALQSRKDAMRAALSSIASAHALTVDFYDRRRIASWVNQHPGLVPWVREKIGRSFTGWRPFGDWSSSPAPLDKPYLLDNAVRLRSPTIRDTDGLNAADGVNLLRRLLLPNGVIRLVGLSGVGKTRLVQALFDARLSRGALPPCEAIYTDLSDEPNPLPLELADQLIHQRRRAILIIDNCGIELHRKLARKIKATNGLLSLITIEYDITDDEPENTDVFKLEAASVELIERMLGARFPALTTPSHKVIAEFSDGNARIAFALAETARHGESLVNLRDRELFRRLFYQNKGPNEPLLNAAKVCALLYSFDGETLDDEDSELARLATLANTTTAQLYAHVAELERRQLVQKRGKWRAILPHAIAQRLANLALHDVPLQLIEKVIVDGGSERMLRSFSKRLGYLHDNPQAVALVVKWFGSGGLLELIGLHDALGMALFTNVAPIDPEATLNFIERAAAAKYPWFFGLQNQHRIEITRTLRSLAYDPALFDRCAALLKQFALQDSDRQHPGTDALESLFFVRFSGTHATTSQRASFMATLLGSDEKAERQLGYRLLAAMLLCVDFFSIKSFEFGARKRDFGAHPRHRQDYVDWFSEALRVSTTLALTDKPAAPEIRRILASNFAELCSHTRMVDELIAVADAIIEHAGWPEGWIGVQAAVLGYKQLLDPTEYAKLEMLAERLRPTNLANMVRCYALPANWSALDPAELDVDADTGESFENVVELCVDLGRQLATDRHTLRALLPEILASNSFKTENLGQGLAAQSASLTEIWHLLKDAFLSAPEGCKHPTILGGFIEGAMKRNAEETESLLDASLADLRMHPTLLYLQTAAGLTRNGFARLMRALDVDTIPLSTYDRLCKCVPKEIADDDLRRLILKLCSKKGGQRIAIHIVGTRIAANASDNLPISEVEKAAAREVLALVNFEQHSSHDDSLLGAIIMACLEHPACEPLARSLCRSVAAAISNHHIYGWDLHGVIDALAKVSPLTVLDVLAEQANNEEQMARRIFSEARNSTSCALESIPDATLVGWASEKPTSRYIDLAEVVRFSDANENKQSTGWSSVAMAVIEAAPDPANVLDVFLDRFVPMSWGGSRAAIMASRLVMIESLYQHAQPNIVTWAKAHAPEFSRLIEAQRAKESQNFRDRDERFE